MMMLKPGNACYQLLVIYQRHCIIFQNIFLNNIHQIHLSFFNDFTLIRKIISKYIWQYICIINFLYILLHFFVWCTGVDNEVGRSKGRNGAGMEIVILRKNEYLHNYSILFYSVKNPTISGATAFRIY